MHFFGSFRNNYLFVYDQEAGHSIVNMYRVSLSLGCLGDRMGDGCWPMPLDGSWVGDCSTMRKTKE